MFQLLLVVIYLAFISLGLPDSLLGSAWPSMYGQLQVPFSYAGIISMIIAVGTIISSLQSDRLTKKLGTGKVTMISVAMTAIALLGFSLSNSFWALCLFAIPFGLGAGSVDASLNNYVALHYASRHMSWLHCMWGVGASLGPGIMGAALTRNLGWATGYRWISFMQIGLTVILFLSLPLWNKTPLSMQKEGKREGKNEGQEEGHTEGHKEEHNEGQREGETNNEMKNKQPLTLKEIFKIPRVKAVMLTFFCYCALEQTAGLWASSYLTLQLGLDPTKAASFASLFFIGITIGRALGGFLTILVSDKNMVRIGQSLILLGILTFFIPNGQQIIPVGLVLIGLGCAPIYPSVIHSTPVYFGKEKSQAIIGVLMASAYVGILVMPPLFGMISNLISIKLFPLYLMAILLLMAVLHEKVVRKQR